VINTMKYLSIFVCLALLITSIVFLPFETDSKITAGKGNGKNEKIEEPEDFLEFLTHFTGNDPIDMRNDKITFLSYADEDTTEENEKTNKHKYESVTMHESTHMANYSSSTYDNSTYSSSQTISRQLSIYMTQNASYYHTIGQIKASQTNDSIQGADGNYQLYIDFDIEIYIDNEDDILYIKFNSWDMISSSETTIISNEILGKWVYLGSYSYELLDFVDDMNRDALKQFGSIIEDAIDDNLFDKNKGQYSLNKKGLKEALGFEDLDKGNFLVDMSDSESPIIDMHLGTSSKSDSSTDSKYSSSYYIDSKMVFENINNTIVEMDEDVDILEIDEDDIEDYFIVED